MQNTLDEATGILGMSRELWYPLVEIVAMVRKFFVDRLRPPFLTLSQLFLLSVSEGSGIHKFRAHRADPFQTSPLAFFFPGGSQVTKAIGRFPDRRSMSSKRIARHHEQQREGCRFRTFSLTKP